MLLKNKSGVFGLHAIRPALVNESAWGRGEVPTCVAFGRSEIIYPAETRYAFGFSRQTSLQQALWAVVLAI